LVKIWAQVAKSDPAGTSNLNCGGVEWKALNLGDKLPLKYLNLENLAKIVDEPLTDRMEFWKSLNLASILVENRKKYTV
jgi:hypothetical protein